MKNIYDICKLRFREKIRATLIVSIFWVSGLLFGRFAAAVSGDASVYVMRLSATVKPVLILQIAGQLTPLAVTFLLARTMCVKSLWPVIFSDAFCFGYAAFLSVRAFGTAGWLVYRILLFSECANAFILLWIWLNVTIDRRFLSLRKFCLFSGAMCLVTLFDYLVCSEFLISVLT